MAALIPLGADGLSAMHNFQTNTLTIYAKGTIHGVWMPPFFERKVWFGGIRYALKAFHGMQVPENPDVTDVDVKHQEVFNFPGGRYPKFVIIETALGTFKVEISFIQWPLEGAAANGKGLTDENNGTVVDDGPIKDDSVITNVLPTKELLLLADGILTIEAAIPVTIPEAKAWVTISADAVFFNLIGSKLTPGLVSWEYKWTKVPSLLVPLPLIDVTTTIATQLSPLDPTIITRNIQPYVVKLVSLNVEQPKE
ncbi:hypothetical protein B0H66DRAFT_466249 [Apodospora peruviana]|uniref:Uncharacterized protein n=1 Tax=Apodospora peruviana TaxID=516989 RepID=A0AAE0IUX9_9PEZI|nr:hypothetical protein B0H66DRAFT_466249 [Apodospora peruviana]